MDVLQQITNITKAHAYDIVSEQVKDLKIDKEILETQLRQAKQRIIYLESLIKEYSDKIKSI